MSKLLEGLQTSIIKKSELENLQTIGSEYYSPLYVQTQATLRSSNLPRDTLFSLCSLITDGDHGIADYQDEGIQFVLSENVKEGWIDTAQLRHISTRHHSTLKRSSLKPGDVLVTKTGAYFGKSAVVDISLGEANTIAHVGILRPKKKINPRYLSTFLNCKYGQSQLRRRGIKATRPEIKLVEFRDIEVPLPSPLFQSRVDSVIVRSQEARSAVKAVVRRAEDTLLEVLGLAGWMPPEPLAYTARLSDVFNGKRMDAQFHRPKYAELKATHEMRGDLFALDGMTMKGWAVPYSESGSIPIIRSGDLNDIDDEAEFLRADESERIFYLVRGDVIVSSIGFGSIGKVQVFDKSGRYGTVSEVTVIRQSIVNSYYLAAYLKSFLGQMQIDRYITGATGQLHLYPKDVAKIFVPLIPGKQQEEFEHIHIEACTLRDMSRQLIEAAKRSVEIAIEESESAAIAFLDAAAGAS